MEKYKKRYYNKSPTIEEKTLKALKDKTASKILLSKIELEIEKFIEDNPAGTLSNFAKKSGYRRTLVDALKDNYPEITNRLQELSFNKFMKLANLLVKKSLDNKRLIIPPAIIDKIFDILGFNNNDEETQKAVTIITGYPISQIGNLTLKNTKN